MSATRRTALAAMLWLGVFAAARGEERPGTENVVLVTLDGFRWQEVFRGADEALMNREYGAVADVEGLKKEFGGRTAGERRAALLPFLWTVVAKQGQLFGNADRGSLARVTNGRNFSYPGYNEILTGAADPRIDSNAKRPNPNISVLEWLNGKPGFAGRVAAFGAWDVFPYILNRDRSKLYVNAGWDPIEGEDLSERQTLLNQLIRETHRPWADCRLDSLTYRAAREHLDRHGPRVLYIAFGETDEFAHEGRYDHYLHAAHRADALLKDLWDGLQASPRYRGKTSLIVTTDHGRGDAPNGWRDHGAAVKGSERIWVAVLGPDTPALGERSDVPEITQAQVAATVAALLGEDFAATDPRIAGPIDGVVRPSPR